MSRRKTTEEQIAATKKQIEQYEMRMQELLSKQKEQERKDRTRRLIERGAIAESLIDGATTLTNEQFKQLVAAALNSDPAIEMLLTLQEQTAQATPKDETDKAQTPATAPPVSAEAAAHPNPSPGAKPAEMAQNCGTGTAQSGNSHTAHKGEAHAHRPAVAAQNGGMGAAQSGNNHTPHKGEAPAHRPAVTAQNGGAATPQNGGNGAGQAV